MIRDYPAYGRTIARHIVRGEKPICVAVLLSSRWDYFDHVPKVCIKPDEWAARRYEFGFLRGLHVVLVIGDDCTEVQIAELVVELMRVGPILLWVFNADGVKVYEDDLPTSLAQWASSLSGGKVDYRNAKVAALVMEAAQRIAARRWVTELERIRERAPEKETQFHLRDYVLKDRVRELFSTPYRAIGEAHAA